MKKLKANCIHCGKPVFSLYKKQLDYNIQAHEISCPEKLKGDGIKSSKTETTHAKK